jgi:hypothetical protein
MKASVLNDVPSLAEVLLVPQYGISEIAEAAGIQNDPAMAEG